MLKKIILVSLFLSFIGCKSLSELYFYKNEVNCTIPNLSLDLENIEFLDNNKFKIIREILHKKYNAKEINTIFYIKSSNLYYAEYYLNNYTTECIILTPNFEYISSAKIQFEL